LVCPITSITSVTRLFTSASGEVSCAGVQNAASKAAKPVMRAMVVAFMFFLPAGGPVSRHAAVIGANALVRCGGAMFPAGDAKFRARVSPRESIKLL
jgi:hypothetical protein